MNLRLGSVDHYATAPGTTVPELAQRTLQDISQVPDLTSLSSPVESIITKHWPNINGSEIGAMRTRTLERIDQQIQFPSIIDSDTIAVISSAISFSSSQILGERSSLQDSQFRAMSNKIKFVVPILWSVAGFIMLMAILFWKPKSPQSEVKREAYINGIGFFLIFLISLFIIYNFYITSTPPIGDKGYYLISNLPLLIGFLVWYYLFGMFIILTLINVYARFSNYAEIYAVSRRLGVGKYLKFVPDFLGNKMHRVVVDKIIDKIVKIATNRFLDMVIP